MRKTALDSQLEAAVAKALGVPLPYKMNRRMVPVKKTTHHAVKHAA